MAPSSHYDLIVIGSGQSGTPLATAFAKAGKRTAMIERAHIGGTCINEGCTPTKTMIASGRAAYMARRAGDYGVKVHSPVIADMALVRRRKRNIVESWSRGGEEKLRKAGVDIIKGTGRFVGPKEVEVVSGKGGEARTLEAMHVVINTGERPARPDIPGLDGVDAARVLDSTSIMELGEVPNHLVCVGGGYVSLEFGQLFRRLGAEVTVVQRGKQLLPREDADIADQMLKIVREDGITVHLSATVKAVTAGSSGGVDVSITTGSGEVVVAASHVLLAAGRKPNTDLLNLAAAGIETTSRGHVKVNERLETNVQGVYAIGDVHGGPAFTHISYDDFRILRANILPEAVPATTPAMTTTTSSFSRRATPYVVYTDPQLGHIGLHAKEAAEGGRRVKTATMPMGYVARAIETGETRGLMKATVDAETGEILGFTCLGIEGGEIMAVVQAAMMGGLKWWDLEAAVWAHPSLAESLNNLWAYLE
ncbi:hypothetical protein B0T11DRAFT_231888 [Plectosphaerella cucumerina]|uniref:Mercuric reductase n=1 Tax=Plectosphaerella cucumerina TaxID=40658 RepID=A0A8K0WYH7_9PEZI|nr:hypothetical protein B0T11DRAFT_231888 [Plectosphaerella cucumerina]